MATSIEKILALIPAQRGFLVESLAGEGEEYKQQICIKLELTMHPDQLEKNIRNAVNSHPMLRTVFDWSEGDPLQIVLDGAPVAITRIRTQEEINIQSIMLTERAYLQTLDKAPPISFAIIESQPLYLLLTYSHIILDGPSIGVLLEEIITGNAQTSLDSEDYLRWYYANIGQVEKEYWNKYLRYVLARDTKLNVGTIENLQSFKNELSSEFSRNLLKTSQKLSVTPAEYMQTLWGQWAQHYFNKDTLVYGMVSSTRVAGVCDNNLGPYICTIPWISQILNTSFEECLDSTKNTLDNMRKAKHVALGEIAKVSNPAILGIEAILTINTSPITNPKLYDIVETYENTQYILSCDIEIADSVTVQHSGKMINMSESLMSFVYYCEKQGKKKDKKLLQNSLSVLATRKEPSKHSSFKNTALFIELVAQATKTQTSDINMSDSFLENGGDSISALRLKSLLKSTSNDASIADILQASTLENLKQCIKAIRPHSNSNSGSKYLERCKDILGPSFELASTIPAPAKYIVNAYRSGFGQDYHEQTCFRLLSIFEEDIMARAIIAVSKEFPTLRMHYPNELPELQLLSSNSRISLEVRALKGQSFDEYCSAISSELILRPIKIDSGPLARIIIGQKNINEWYFFMSFSALVTDGWAFSTLLLRLFECYDQIKTKSYVQLSQQKYMQYSTDKAPEEDKDEIVFGLPSADYVSDVSGLDYTIDAIITEKIIEYSKEKQITLSNAVLELASLSLMDDFSEIAVYKDSRYDSDTMNMVGPFSMLVDKRINYSQSINRAYYVFENYPRTDENKLRDHEINTFNEKGSWRRDLLPPKIDLGLLFDWHESKLSVRILTRRIGSNYIFDHSTYWDKLKEIFKKELK